MLTPHRGRQARPASAAWNVLKTSFQMIVFWMMFLAVFPLFVIWMEDQAGLSSWRFAGPWWRISGSVLFLAASALGVISAATMAIIGRGTPLPLDCPRELVVRGPYRFVRNPMALAGISQGIAVGLYFGSPIVVLYALAGGPVWNYLVRPWEEKDLDNRFGESFRTYQREVRCWCPRLTPYAPMRASEFIDKADTAHAEGEQTQGDSAF